MEEKEGEMIKWATPEVKKGYRAYLLPDSFLIVCPDVWPQNAPVEVSAYVAALDSPNIQQLTMHYSSNGKFIKLQNVIYEKV